MGDIFHSQSTLLLNCSNDVRQMKMLIKSTKSKLETAREEHLDRLLAAKIQVGTLLETLVKSRDRYENSYRNLTATMASISESMTQYVSMFKNFETDTQEELNDKTVEFNKLKTNYEKRLAESSETENRQKLEIEKLKNEKDILKNEKEKLKYESDKLRNGSGKLKNESNELKSEIGSLKNENVILKQKSASTLPQTNKEASHEEKRLNKTYSDVEMEISSDSDLKAKLRELTIVNDELNEKMAEMQESLNYFESVANQKLVEAENLQQNLNRTEDELAETKERVSQTRTTWLENKTIFEFT